MKSISQELREIATWMEGEGKLSQDIRVHISKLLQLASQLEWIIVAKDGNPKENGWYEVTVGCYGDYFTFIMEFENSWKGLNQDGKVIAYRKPLQSYEGD